MYTRKKEPKLQEKIKLQERTYAKKEHQLQERILYPRKKTRSKKDDKLKNTSSKKEHNLPPRKNNIF